MCVYILHNDWKCSVFPVFEMKNINYYKILNVKYQSNN